MPPTGRRWPFGLYRVAGDSMRPTFQPGDTLLGWRWLNLARLKPGTIVVARLADGRPVIKRIHARTPDGWFDLRGDNPVASTDSRHFGPVAGSTILACVLWRLP